MYATISPTVYFPVISILPLNNFVLQAGILNKVSIMQQSCPAFSGTQMDAICHQLYKFECTSFNIHALHTSEVVFSAQIKFGFFLLDVNVTPIMDSTLALLIILQTCVCLSHCSYQLCHDYCCLYAFLAAYIFQSFPFGGN